MDDTDKLLKTLLKPEQSKKHDAAIAAEISRVIGYSLDKHFFHCF